MLRPLLECVIKRVNYTFLLLYTSFKRFIFEVEDIHENTTH